jgi:sugar phosphate isomerase/epimerase
MGSQRMNNPIGVMQGRLLPKYQGRYQAHPVGYWQDEFPKATELGLYCIEFILDYNDAEHNPLMTQEGCKEIQAICERTGVKVLSVCADYFMEAPLHSENSQKAEQSIEVLQQLLKTSEELGIRDIVIPCVDQSSIKSEPVRSIFLEALTTVIPNAERAGVNLSLETDLDAKQFGELLSSLDSPRVTVNYDIGNSASLGYNPVEELSAYGERISDIHLKDRILGGGSVILGTGDADIPSFIKLLEQFDYSGPFIMQAYRDDEGLSIFKDQLNWTRSFF